MNMHTTPRLHRAAYGLGVLGLLILSTAPALAAGDGEYCGNLGFSWRETCDEGLRCDLRWSFGFWGRVGICAATAAQSCGGLQGKGCPERQFCDFAPEADCGAADRTGTCADVPELCTLESHPVCGCDDKTYSSPCDAHSRGIPVASDGACKAAGPCKIAGCSSELCVGPDDPSLSPCIFRPEYACYRDATCELQGDGRCGWTQTPELSTCIDDARASEHPAADGGEPIEEDAGVDAAP